MSTERLGNAMPRGQGSEEWARGSAACRDLAADAPVDGALGSNPDSEALDFVRFCYRRRAACWPELYDEMCAVAARGDYRGLGYEELEGIGVRFVLAALPRLAELAARVIAEERTRPVVTSAA